MTDYTNEILAAALNIDAHSPVSDTEDPIIVNVKTRDFTLGPNVTRIIGVVGDKDSNIVSFSLPRLIDSHDISGCASHKVYWRNIETQKEGEFTIKDIKTSDGEDTVLLGWLISDEVTDEAGEIEYSLEIEDFDSAGQLIYSWNTIYGSGLMVIEGREDKVHPVFIPKSYITLVDQETGKKHNVYVSNGKLMMEERKG